MNPSRLILLVILAGAAMVVGLKGWSYWDFLAQQRALAGHTAAGVAAEIGEDLAWRTRYLRAFVEDEAALIAALAERPDDTARHDRLRARLARDFPDSFAIGLASPDGTSLLADFAGEVGEVCQNDIRAYARTGRAEVFIHPNPVAYHYDLMTRLADGRVFLASFRTDHFARTLAHVQAPGQIVYLVRRDDDLIELAAVGSRPALGDRDFHLSADERARLLHRTPVAGTRWDLAVIQDADFLAHERLRRGATLASLLGLFAGLGFWLHRATRREREAARQALAAENRARAEAERQSAFKSGFLTLMGHELRTPMNAIVGFVDLLMDADLEVRQRTQVAAVRKAAHGLLGLLDNILRVARLEAGELSDGREPFDLDGLLAQLLPRYQELARAKGLALVLDSTVEAGACYLGNPAWLAEVLARLLDNAIKFTLKGEVRLEVRAAVGAGLWVTVADTGIGIAAEKHEAIFDPFTQADGGLTRRYGGAGLGATIARRMVELMGGRLRLDSQPGRGSRFEIDLPWPRVPCPHGQVAPAAPAVLSSAAPVPCRATAAPAAACARLAEALAASAIDDAALAEVTGWARANGQAEAADRLCHALDEFDFDRASHALAELGALAQPGQA